MFSSSTSLHHQTHNQSARSTYENTVWLSASSVELILANGFPDRSLASVLEMLSNRNYTVLYTTTPNANTDDPPANPRQYEMYSDDQPLHSDLKRDVQPGVPRTQSNQTMVDGPLFEKYQFFSPGMGNCCAHLQNDTDSPPRSFHGSPRELPTFINTVRCNFRHSECAS